ncbi:MAG: 4-hydroxythreonine-4-phosphate dehydrogenase PdxA [Planctomycetia bacterium]|nr:4-hydroxythreonine-4-phosphate dehydrogenase PdxA [Planctomycetia bacterium]
MTHPSSPKLLITCGDPAGIGPEVAIASWTRSAAHATARLRVVASADMLAATLRDTPGLLPPGLPPLSLETVAADDDRPSRRETLLVIEPSARGEPVRRGRISAAGGAAAIRALETAFDCVRRGQARAIVTGPLNKEAIHAAGHDVPGHTEWLARACGLPDAAASMMLWLPAAGGAQGGLGVVHATLHESLRDALGHLSTPTIVAAGRRLARVLAALLDRPARLAVAALNPHGGEGGLFGDEEPRLVAPAVERLIADGLDVAGPLPADTLFLRASQGAFDGVVALYHDQGHIPVKLLGMHRAVNITLGLPVVRTSVAHGTAFDIVGTGSADPSSMLAAIDVARRLVAAGGADVTAASATGSGQTDR